MDIARRALDAAPAGLLTDFDGTLSTIVADPASASLVEGAQDALATLAERLAVVAIVSGRGALDARRLVGVPGVLVAGNHGTEWLWPDAAAPEPDPRMGEIRERLDALVARVPPLPGVRVEHKGLSATVHYRQAPDPAAAREAIHAALAAAGDGGIERRDGLMSVELRPRGIGDKGEAARRIIDRYGLRGVVVLGDDVTDLDMFAAVAERRARGELEGAIVAVGGAEREVPPDVAAAADVILDGPASAARLLAALADDR
ncbi:MAG TPA: trehalose-phosphatase [Candidatus Limnocylindria bacterium]|nr:trehalose-phosphatase [Candidatus Limnocylindria bacterium]